MFSGGEPFDLVAWMNTNLQAINPSLMWEFGPSIERSGGYRLTITPESVYSLEPLVAAILALAPRIDGWEFYGSRPPETLETAETMVQARTGGTLAGVEVVVSKGDHNLIDLNFLSTTSTAQHDAFLATESLLGEDVLNTWIGELSASVPRPKRGLFSRTRSEASGQGFKVPIADLRERVEQERQAIVASLPAGPRCSAVGDASGL